MSKEFYEVLEKTIDYAFDGKYMLNMYDYLKSIDASKILIEEFQMSSTASEIKSLIVDLEGYIEGGDDGDHKQLREGYGYLGKPEARKIKNYLLSLINDAERYKNDKRPGRRRKSSK